MDSIGFTYRACESISHLNCRPFKITNEGFNAPIFCLKPVLFVGVVGVATRDNIFGHVTIHSVPRSFDERDALRVFEMCEERVL